MKNEIASPAFDNTILYNPGLFDLDNIFQSLYHPETIGTKPQPVKAKEQAEILFITSFPPRECGIATYSNDLINALNTKFSNSFTIKICALESGKSQHNYPDKVKYIFDTSVIAEYKKLAHKINNDKLIKIVVIQHEFGFYHGQERAFLRFLYAITKPVVIVFHTVLPQPDKLLKSRIKVISETSESIVVMTLTSKDILIKEYGVPAEKISVIAHGTHLVPRLNKNSLKLKYGLKDRKVLTTFGLLSAGKGIETTIEALPDIIKHSPEVMFLVLGKTHPEVVKTEGEKYREMLEQKVIKLGLQDHVKFINTYLELPVLLEYLQLTDIYLFTANDPNQAVSGTFVYAMSCGCPIISTPIPHAKELLTRETGIIIDFKDSINLTNGVIRLLSNDKLRREISKNALQNIVPTAWENSAIAHANLFATIAGDRISLHYNYPPIKLNHLKQMTTRTGIIQFSRINQPDLRSGYTLDDNARALVAICMYFELTGNTKSIEDIKKYLGFIRICQQPKGDFLNYVDGDLNFTAQNKTVNLDDSNGRAIWALGYVTSLKKLLPDEIVETARTMIEKALPNMGFVHSTRAMAFIMKGLYYLQGVSASDKNIELIKTFADRMVQMYRHESGKNWEWFESYLTYANSTMPEAMVYAWLLTGQTIYKDIALTSFKFLLSQTFTEKGIEVISNKNWLIKGQQADRFGEQPIDVAYTIMTLSTFYDVFTDEDYRLKMETAFNWFLGNNHLHQIIYNPSTGGCHDGLEKTQVNLNQGAESTVSYLMARLTVEKHKNLKAVYI
jgi:glycosyltransferase involved in cell wall biosynthesis